MRTMHLFAGVGGGLLADLILGHTPVVAVEWEPYACQVLRERAAEGWFPDLRVWEGDVRLFDPSEYAGSVDCIHAGFPCQDISVAGKQAGVGEETRSGLYREVLRIAGVVRPRYLFLENVAAIVTNGLGTVLDDLAALGYDAEWLCLRASDCGANHHRDRWWLLADSNGNEWGASGLGQNSWTNRGDNACRMGEVLADSRRNTHEHERISRISDGASSSMQGKTRKQWFWVEATNCGEDVADTSANNTSRTDTQGRQGQNERQTRPCGDGLGWWETEPDVGRVVDGVSARIHRLKGLGNAQVPIQAAVAWKLLGGE